MNELSPNVRENPVLGLVLNVPLEKVPPLAWVKAHNVRFQDGRVKNAFGWTKFANAAAGDGSPVLLIARQTDTEGTERIVVATGKRFYNLLGADMGLQLLPNSAPGGADFSASLQDRWTYDVAKNSTLYAAQLNDAVQVLQAAGNSVGPLPGTKACLQLAANLTIITAGANYVTGDVVTLNGAASGDTAATLKLYADSTGAVTTAQVLTQGSYATQPSGTLGVTGGSGTGLTVSVSGNTQPAVTPPKGRYLITFEDHLVLAYVVDGNGADLQAWANSGLMTQGAGFSDWFYAGNTNDADFLDITEGGGPIMGLVRLGKRALINKQMTNVLMAYAGMAAQGEVWSKMENQQRVGAFAPYAFADAGEPGIIFPSQNSIHVMDAGGSLGAIGDRVWRAWLADLLSEDKGLVYARAIHKDLEWLMAYPSVAGAPRAFDKALVLGGQVLPDQPPNSSPWLIPAWSTRDWPFTEVGVGLMPTAALGQVNQSWDQLNLPWVQQQSEAVFCGDVEGNVYLYGRPELSADGKDLTAVLESGLSDLGTPDQIKLVHMVNVRLAACTGTPLLMQVGATDSPEQAIMWSDPQPVNGSNRYPVDVAGRFIAIRFTKTGGTFELSGYDLLARAGGQW